jgi:hypothetical protein
MKRRAILGAFLLALLAGTVFVLRGGSDGGLADSASEEVAVLGNSSVAAASERTALTRASTTGPIFGTGTYQGVSPAVRDLPLLPAPPSTAAVPREGEHAGYPGRRTEAADPVVQSEVGDAPMPAPLVNFDGICGGFASCTVGSTCQCLPPDTVGEVGLDHYVQMVNSSFAIWSKDGTEIQGPTNINQLWNGTGGRCETQNDGDPIVLYDQLANRWFLSQFVGATSPYALCIAISTTGDPTGAYYRYEFGFGGVFHDYPKYSVRTHALVTT